MSSLALHGLLDDPVPQTVTSDVPAVRTPHVNCGGCRIQPRTVPPGLAAFQPLGGTGDLTFFVTLVTTRRDSDDREGLTHPRHRPGVQRVLISGEECTDDMCRRYMVNTSLESREVVARSGWHHRL